MVRGSLVSATGSAARGDALLKAEALTTELRSRSADIESQRRLPLDLVARLREAGVFRLCVPHSLGGSESDVGTILHVLETISRADASAGWCAMIGATSGIVSGYLAEPCAREIYGNADAISGGVFAPRGKAVLDGSSYVVTGRWPFASGCQHCTWLMGGCIVAASSSSLADEGRMPEARMMLFPAAEAVIHDTWNVAGLCGTGSHDIEVRGLRVPAERSVSLSSDNPKSDAPLYRFPVFGLLALGIAAVTLGIARRAIDELVEVAGAKTPTGSRRRLAERSAVQADVARAHAGVESAGTYVHEVVEQAYERARAGALDAGTRARLRLAATHATTAAAMAVDRMYEAGGGSSIYATSPLQRCLRDIHVATQHAMVAAPTYELVGRVLLELPTEISLL